MKTSKGAIRIIYKYLRVSFDSPSYELPDKDQACPKIVRMR